MAEPSVCILTEKWQHPYFSGPISNTTGKKNAVTFCLKHIGEAKRPKGHWGAVSYTDVICHHSRDLKAKLIWRKGFLSFSLDVTFPFPVHEFKIPRKWVLIWGSFQNRIRDAALLWQGLAKCWWYKLTNGGQVCVHRGNLLKADRVQEGKRELYSS